MSAIVKIKDARPRGIVIHPNDTVSVTLTATGADILNDLNKRANTGRRPWHRPSRTRRRCSRTPSR